MYDELVKRLRYCQNNAAIITDDELMSVANDAVIAIEELQQTVEYYKGCSDDWFIEACDYKSMLPHWIPVAERLPDSGVHVLASCRSPGGCRYVCDAFYSAPKTEVCSYSDDIDMEYDEETDEYYMPVGWWEVIKNWDEYSCIGIEDSVTHWQPLPEPPKEETC